MGKAGKETMMSPVWETMGNHGKPDQQLSFADGFSWFMLLPFYAGSGWWFVAGFTPLGVHVQETSSPYLSQVTHGFTI